MTATTFERVMDVIDQKAGPVSASLHRQWTGCQIRFTVELAPPDFAAFRKEIEPRHVVTILDAGQVVISHRAGLALVRAQSNAEPGWISIAQNGTEDAPQSLPEGVAELPLTDEAN